VLGVHDLWLFLASGLLLNVTPGPDTLYVVGRASTLGWRGGAVAALGIGAGVSVHISAAALGLSAILAASATAYTLVKLTGAAYLVYVGLSMIFASAAARVAQTSSGVNRPADMRKVFLQGFLTNVLNPKVALFFLAFLPQFVAADAASKPLAFLFLGAVFDLTGTGWNLTVAWSAARLSGRARFGSRFTRWFNRGVGSLFVGIGLRLAFARER
jgi:threonine/homoserine/homoserine lactone efflux protein